METGIKIDKKLMEGIQGIFDELSPVYKKIYEMLPETEQLKLYENIYKDRDEFHGWKRGVKIETAMSVSLDVLMRMKHFDLFPQNKNINSYRLSDEFITFLSALEKKAFSDNEYLNESQIIGINRLVDMAEEILFKNVVLKFDYLNGPLWKDVYDEKHKCTKTGIGVIDEDISVQTLNEIACTIYSSLYSFNGDEPCTFDEEKFQIVLPVLKNLVGLIYTRLCSINDGSYVVIDETIEELERGCLHE